MELPPGAERFWKAGELMAAKLAISPKLQHAQAEKIYVDVAMVVWTLAKPDMCLGECLAMHRDHWDASNCQYKIMETVRPADLASPKPASYSSISMMVPKAGL